MKASLYWKEIFLTRSISSLSAEDSKLYREICRTPDDILDYLSGWKVQELADDEKERDE